MFLLLFLFICSGFLLFSSSSCFLNRTLEEAVLCIQTSQTAIMPLELACFGRVSANRIAKSTCQDGCIRCISLATKFKVDIFMSFGSNAAISLANGDLHETAVKKGTYHFHPKDTEGLILWYRLVYKFRALRQLWKFLERRFVLIQPSARQISEFNIHISIALRVNSSCYVLVTHRT